MPAKRIKKQAKNPKAPQQQEQLNNKMAEDSAGCIRKISFDTDLSVSEIPTGITAAISHRAERKGGMVRIHLSWTTRINWVTPVCKVLFKNKTGAEAADHQEQVIVPAVESHVTSDGSKKIIALKSCLKKPVGELGSNANRIVKKPARVHLSKLKFS